MKKIRFWLKWWYRKWILRECPHIYILCEFSVSCRKSLPHEL